MTLVKIRFLKTYTVKSVDGVTYQEGSVHELREDSANHFTRRGLAVSLSEDGSESIENQAQPQTPPANERELTTTIDLISAFNRSRIQAGVEVKPPEPPRLPPEPPPEPVVVTFGDDPLVSCIMPTWNRRGFIHAAIDCWLKQTYENKELIIIDDGEEAVRNIVPRKKGIRYFRRENREITGTKRNNCCELAKGEIICHFDDDDWSAPDRIEHQLGLLRSTGKPIAGYGTLYFWDSIAQHPKRYRASVKGYVCGTTLMYLKSYWKEHPFLPKQEASDNSFVYPALKLIANSHDASHMVARIHNQHTSSKTGITEACDKDLLPPGFWENEELRLK